MKILEKRPERYDVGINILSGGHSKRIKEQIVQNHVKPGMEILDVGCGTGSLAIDAAKADARVTGVDISTGMLAVAQKRIAEHGMEDRITLYHAGVVEAESGLRITRKDRSFLDSFMIVTAKKSVDDRFAKNVLPRTRKSEDDFSLMKSLWDFIGRWFPNPVEPGLRVIGKPDRNSPVLLTSNIRFCCPSFQRRESTGGFLKKKPE